MGAWELLLVALVMLIGLCGVLLPGVPGSWLVWAAVLWWTLTDPHGLAWGIFLGASAVLLTAQAVRWQLPARRLRSYGADRRMVAAAGAGALLGFVLLPVVGAVPGFLLGGYLFERLRLGSHAAAAAATRTALRHGGSRILVELFACLLIMGAWLGAVIAA
ncbi:DUF456 domain-containing protein [Streptomyces physcomitrii]|uniref:DUF456 domain-containing protein n=1 Tax=Streptomyces physcomitrii TaxID=2724184 RepID=A0ABX1H878_9ACTN|nr:DUF456 domain-containing protein [Streptomyces physcomitrii]NKI44552.1 DUF456 domain-containing protein [Streptomyces physcomitrii]